MTREFPYSSEASCILLYTFTFTSIFTLEAASASIQPQKRYIDTAFSLYASWSISHPMFSKCCPFMWGILTP